jgi:hypothetical protein
MVNPLARNIVKAIFEDKESIIIKNKTIHRKLFANGTVRGFDVGGYRWIEQNRGSGSEYAKMAQQGNKIVWVIRLIKPEEWVALVIDGRVHQRKDNGWWEEVGTIFDHEKGTL